MTVNFYLAFGVCHFELNALHLFHLIFVTIFNKIQNLTSTDY